MNCGTCKKLLSPKYKFCPECGTQVVVPVSDPVKRIPERFLSVIAEYEFFTKTKLSESEKLRFIEYPPVGKLSVNASERRVAAAQRVLVPRNDGTFKLDVLEWEKAMYDIDDPQANRIERVWITSGGEKYHKDRDCKALAAGQSFARWKGKDTYKPQYITLRDAAWIMGKIPCEICKPKIWK